MLEIQVDAQKCTGCAKCVDACDLDAVRMHEKVAIIDVVRCMRCTSCVAVCETNAIRILSPAGKLN